MDSIIAFVNWFTGNQWVALAALVISIIALIYAAIPVHWNRNQRKLDAARNEPGAKATINRTPSVDGWRSIQIHITPPPAQIEAFRFQRNGWRIVNAKLLSPRNAQLAFAREDDHSLRGPIIRSSPRRMSGRVNHPQPFAMEFFIRFEGTPHADRGKRAKFRVIISHSDDPDLSRALKLWAEVPIDADTQHSI